MKFLCERSQASGLIPMESQTTDSADPMAPDGANSTDAIMYGQWYTSGEDETVPAVSNENLNRAITQGLRSWFTPLQSSLIQSMGPPYTLEYSPPLARNGGNGNSIDLSENNDGDEGENISDEHSEESDYGAYHDEDRAFQRQVHFSNPVSDIFEL